MRKTKTKSSMSLKFVCSVELRKKYSPKNIIAKFQINSEANKKMSMHTYY